MSNTSAGFQQDQSWYNQDADIFVGFILAIFTILATVENVSVFVMFAKFSEIRSRTTIFLMSLCVSDGIMAVVGGTMFAISSFYHHWIFGNAGCIVYGFIMFGVGCTDITLLMLIALDRMLAIMNPIRYKAMGNYKFFTPCLVVFGWFYGFFWAALPLMGVQEYTLEGQISCSINWLSRKESYVIYNVFLFIGSFFIPLIIMFICYILIFVTVKMAGKRFAGGQDEASLKKQATEKKLALNLGLTMFVYMLVWTPYAVVSMYGSFGDASVIPPGARAFAPVFAKFSMAINPFIYVFSNKSHRKKLRAMFGIANAVEIAPEDRTRQVTVAPTAKTTGAPNNSLRASKPAAAPTNTAISDDGVTDVSHV